MKVFIVLATILAVALAQNYPDESPKPYSFNYVAEGEEGSSSHSETSDGSGVVRGTYSLTDMDGRTRVVEYIAGPEGYNAVVRTNEPGTVSGNPADVTIESTADTTQFHSAPAAMTRPAQARPVVTSGGGSTTTVRTATTTTSGAAGAQGGAGGGRFVLVPADDPRARAYYGQS